ncbi:MAG: hypothetical protein SOI64_00175 [Bifidobacterium mongoliense]|uniref:hypothetical protein n=1 Tax=Bifidobacterium mongoliense TaxID=518643 RepID=UPI002F35089C
MGSIYICILLAYVLGVPDADRFPGMMPRADATPYTALPFDMTSFAFLMFGVLLSLEQPSDYLLADNWKVYVRRRRGVSRYMRYLAVVFAYALAFSFPQLVIIWLAVRGSFNTYVLAGFACSTGMLIVLLLVVNIARMLGSRAVGYLMCLLVAYGYSGIGDIQHVFAAHTLGTVPNWSIIIVVAVVGMATVNIAIYNHKELL